MFGRWRQPRTAIEPLGAAGYRAYAIGDVHGRIDLLDALLARIAEDHEQRSPGVSGLLVFLGDLIDRGPDSRAVVDRVATGAIPGFRTICLAGNHEEVMIRLLDGEEGLFGRWLGFGGAECVTSYGLDPLRLQSLPESDAIAELREAVPQEHRDFLVHLGDTFRFGDYLFVHAGLRPGIPLERQSPLDLRWIREPFIGDPREHGMMVVHGHTITEKVDERSNRIGIDTGAYRYGRLTALAIDGSERWFIQQDGKSCDQLVK